MRLRTTLAPTLALALLASTLFATAGAARPQRRVSLVLTNGKVFTADERGTLAEAVAVDGGRVVAVGTSREISAGFRGSRTVDLRGRLVTPGFNDAHIHFLGGGLSLLRVNFTGAGTLAEAKARVA
ncbi:MAG TPA: amidohydrolase family protein, partial [Pyrinomonadaceae bacterium]|nr:amidohydrolase family protein [Pyrinomonadaceae bacterium]